MEKTIWLIVFYFLWGIGVSAEPGLSVRIVDVRWVETMHAIHIVLDKWPGVWPGWRMYLDGVEIPMEGGPGRPVIRPDAPLSQPPTGLFVGTLPWHTGLDNVAFPCCGTIQFFIPGRGLTNAFEYNLRDYGCKTASAKKCPSEAELWSSYPRGDQPWAIAITPDGCKVYVPCWMSDNVFVIDTKTNTVLKVIDLSGAGPDGAGPRAAGVSPDGRKLYVANARSANIAVIDTATDQIVRLISLGSREAEIAAARARAAPTTGDPHRPAKILFLPDGSRAYTVFYTSLLIIDVQQDKIMGRRYFESGFFPFDLAMSADGKKLYIGGQSPGKTHAKFYVLDTTYNSFTEIFEVNAFVEGRAGIALSADTQVLYLSSGDPFVLYEPTSGHNKIYYIDLLRKSVVKEVIVTGGPLRMRLSPDGKKAYVATMASPELLVVDLVAGKLDTTIPVRGLRGGLTDKVELVLNPDGTYAYIAALDQDGVMVVDLVEKRMVKFIPFNYFLVQPYFMTITPDETRAYLSAFSHERRGGSIVVVDLQEKKVLSEIMVRGSVRGSDVTPDGSFLYVAIDLGEVWIISTSKNEVVKKIVVGEPVNDVVIRPDGRKAYVMGQRYLHVLELPSNQIMRTMDIGPNTQIGAFSPNGTLLFVTLNRGGVVFIDTATDRVISKLEPPVPIAAESPKLAFGVSPDGKFAYWGYFYDYLHIIDVNSKRVVRAIHLGEGRWEADCAPSAAAVTPDGTRIYVTMHDGNYVAVVDTRLWRVVKTISVGFAPTDISISRNGRWAYVLNFQSESVSVIDLVENKVTQTISVRP